MNKKTKDILSILLIESILFLGLLVVISVENYAICGGVVLLFSVLMVYLKKTYRGLIERIQVIFRDNKRIAKISFVCLLMMFPFFQANNPYWIQVAIMVGLYIIMALGLNIMVGNAGLVCLGYAAFYAIGAYTYGILATKFGLSFWICLPLSGLMVMVFGFILGLPALRVKGHYLALVTIAFGLVVYQLTINLEGLTGGTNGLMNIPAPHIGNYSFNMPLDLGFMRLPFHANFYYLILVLVCLAIIVASRISNSLTGLTWNAIREDQLAAQCYGINLTKNKLWAFAFGALFGGIAGAVYASMVGFIAPENFTYSHSILILSMILLGGIDSIPGVIFGAVLLTIVPEKFRAFADYRVMFYGVVIVSILLFKNDGLIPSHLRKYTSAWNLEEKMLNVKKTRQKFVPNSKLKG